MDLCEKMNTDKIWTLGIRKIIFLLRRNREKNMKVGTPPIFNNIFLNYMEEELDLYVFKLISFKILICVLINFL